MINDEVVEEVLRGELEAAKWAVPRTLKIFISSTRDGMYYYHCQTYQRRNLFKFDKIEMNTWY